MKEVLFDHGPLRGGTLFRAPEAIIRADTPEEVPAAFAAMEAARAEGYWLAGYASYELGYLMDARLRPLLPAARPEPLMLFGAFAGPEPAQGWLATAAEEAGRGRIGDWRPDWGRADYGAAFARLHDHIGAGDCYQVNLTFPLRAEVSGRPAGLYHDLRARQAVGHGAYVDLGGPVILSRSPELFFRCDGAGGIETLPMKGTQPRSADPVEDAARRDFLRTDEKNRAENLMIVDLLRNDLSRLCLPGTVKVPELFAVESYATVHQMVSRIQGQLGPDPAPDLACLFAALFPCGSVTGAPKIKAMEIIADLEGRARGVYCGAIGWIAPKTVGAAALGDARPGAMAFSVAIRTLVLPGDGSIRLNVGGGVVQDSTAEAEYDEALWKARFAGAGVQAR